MTSPVSLTPIAMIQSPYRERFGIPRQPGLSPSLKASIVFQRTSQNEAALQGLTQSSHIWVIFFMHANKSIGKATVRPPRLGGKTQIGVFATRSPDRPNPIGLSLVRLEEVKVLSKMIELTVSGGDFLDKTPVLDIKPYIPYCEAISDANTPWTAPQKKPVDAPPHLEEEFSAEFIKEIKEVLQWDPRPASQRSQENRIFGTLLKEYNIRWQVIGERIQIKEINKIKNNSGP